MIYNQVVVVEGKHDEQKIKSIFPSVECIVTNGSEISDETLNLIYEASKTREIILFLDPDFPGKKITNKILQTNGSFQIAYINKEKAKSKNNKKIGIEHASVEDIKDSLSNRFTINNEVKKIAIKDLSDRGIINKSNSKYIRNYLCKALNIPVFNGKSFLKAINILNISLEKIDLIIEGIKDE